MNKNLVKILVGIGLVGLGYGISKCKDLKVNINKTKKPNENGKVDKSKGWGFFTKECEEEVLDKEKFAHCEWCSICNKCNCQEPMSMNKAMNINMNMNPYNMDSEDDCEDDCYEEEYEDDTSNELED